MKFVLNESKLVKLLFEGNENVVVKNGDRFHLEDYIQYFNKPGIIVATIKGNSENGIQQLPVGAVDNFRFMLVTDESAITEQEKSNGKTYESILKEYEVEKNRVIDLWKNMNCDKYESLKRKYGDKFLGMDIMENKKKIEHKEEETDEDDGLVKNLPTEENNTEDNNTLVLDDVSQNELDKIDEKFEFFKNSATKLLKNLGIKAIILAGAYNKKNNIKDSDVKMYVKINNDNYGGTFPVVSLGEPLKVESYDMSTTSSSDSTILKGLKTNLLFIFGDTTDEAISLETLKVSIKDIFDKARISMYDGISVAADPDSKVGKYEVKKLNISDSETSKSKKNRNRISEDETENNKDDTYTVTVYSVDCDTNTATKKKGVVINTTRKFIKADASYTKNDSEDKRITFEFTATKEQEKDSDAYANVLT